VILFNSELKIVLVTVLKMTVSHFPRILGIDPGSRVIGFALMEAKKPVPRSPKDWLVVDIGVVRTSVDLAMPARICEIHDVFFDLVGELRPTMVGIEKAFHGINPSSSLKLSEARGALISAVGRHRTPVREITPAEMKRLVAGSGTATKEQVYQALQAIMGFNKGKLPLDASDALGIAFAVSLSALLPVSRQILPYTAGLSASPPQKKISPT
jgi:crossover junction endodeoxyribonuclease RuvC